MMKVTSSFSDIKPVFHSVAKLVDSLIAGLAAAS